MIEVNYDNLTEQLRNLAAERPEYIYERPDPDGPGPSCLYVHGDKPGCIFGHALNRLGVSLDTLTEYEGAPIEIVLVVLTSDGWITNSLNRQQTLTLSTVQAAQDDEATWASAVSRLDP